MRAKIVLLPGTRPGLSAFGYAEKILSILATSFGHSFTLVQDVIAEQSLIAHQTVLTQETVDLCKSAQAVFLCHANCSGAAALYDALNMPILLRRFYVPESIRRTLSLWPDMNVGRVLSLDGESIQAAAQQAEVFSEDHALSLASVSSIGTSKSIWDNAFDQIRSIPVKRFTAPDAITTLISAPQKLGLLVCPPAAGSMLQAAQMALCPLPYFSFDAAWNQQTGIYAPWIPENCMAAQFPNPAGICFAIAAMLRYSLHLPQEAACLETTLQNVYLSGWRTSDMPRLDGTPANAEHVVSLICQQLQVAGSLVTSEKSIQ